MHQRHNSSKTKMFPGIRMKRKRVGKKVEASPYQPKRVLTKDLLKFLEKANRLTKLQNDIIKEQLETCTEKIGPSYVARLCNLLEKPLGVGNE